MPRRSSRLDLFILEEFKTSNLVSDVCNLISELAVITFGTAFLIAAQLLNNTLASIFFAISIIIGFWAMHFDRGVAKCRKVILQSACFSKTNNAEDMETHAKYAKLQHIFTTVAGCFGMFGMIVFAL